MDATKDYKNVITEKTTATYEEFAKELANNIKSMSFVCLLCGKTIYPHIESVVTEPEIKINLSINKTAYRSGKGNSIKAGDVCDECVKKYDK